MNLLEFLTHAQAHDEDAILYLFQKFKSLILKYAYILEYEDAKSELELFFLELILKMPLKNFGGKDSNFRILAYIKQSMQRHYIYLSKQKSKSPRFLVSSCSSNISLPQKSPRRSQKRSPRQAQRPLPPSREHADGSSSWSSACPLPSCSSCSSSA